MGAPTSESAAPTAGLVGYWSFDEGSGSSAADGSGNGLAGTLNYGAAWAPASSCKLGGCLSLDGNDDYVRVADTSRLRLLGDLTISAWIKPTSLGTAQSIVSKRYEYELGPIAAASPHALSWSHKSSAGELIEGRLANATQSGSWQHVVLVRNAAARTVTGYVGGAVALTGTYTSAPATNTYSLNIGRNPGSGQAFEGLIDEVRIYDRVLTGSEVAAIYGAEPAPPDTQAPSKPTDLRVTAVSASEISLSWTASSDDRGVAGYRVYRNGTQVASPTQTSYLDSGLAPGTTFSYTVEAFDAAGNTSAPSGVASATTDSTPPTRQDVTVASGFVNPTAMAIAPDGRVFVAEQGGKLRIVEDDVLLSQPFVTVSVVSSNERGLLGIAFDPNFATNRYVYVYYTAASPVVNRVSRFTASATNPNVAAAGSEVVILDNVPSETGWHNGGGIHFGGDGKLYVAVGEGHHEDNAQRLDTLSGKLLRIDPSRHDPANPSAIVPTDNPFYTSTTGVNRAIWALGLRNPFTFDIQPSTGRIFVNDVGENAWEEIDETRIGPNTGGTAGRNFGWPTTEGPTTDPRFTAPFHAYPQANGDCAITGGSFYEPSSVNFPSEYVGDYFFADYCAGWIKSIDLSTKAVSTFLPSDGTRDPVDLKVSDDGSLYYLARAVGRTPTLHRLRYAGGNQPPRVVAHPADQTVSVGGAATFSVSASGTQPLAYRWQRNGVDVPGATGSSYTRENAQTADNGAQFRVVVTNAYGSAMSNAATLTVTSNEVPTAAIATPPAGTFYSAGDTISYSGSGTDPEDGTLPPSSLTWRIDFHHESHLHPFMPDTSGSAGSSFTVPRIGETSAEVFFRIHLAATDSDGATHRTFRDVFPRTARMALATNVAGLELALDGQGAVTPFTVTGVVGSTRTLDAPSPQTIGGRSYEFVSWSDGGTRNHQISTPTADTTYTATFRELGTTPVPSAGLVGRWSFDEGSGTTAADGSGNGQTGTLIYGPVWTPAGSCKLGACLSFDGKDDYVRILDASALRLTGDVTISAWIKPSAPGTAQTVVSKRYEYDLGPIAAASPFPLGWSHKLAGGTVVTGILTASTEAGQWQHVVLVREAASRRVTGYKNGAVALAGTYASPPATSTYNVNVGRNAGRTQHFKGLIDEVRIYNRALTATEVSALFNQ